MKPSVGLGVHYCFNGECWAAIITKVVDPYVNLMIFPPNGMPYPETAVRFERFEALKDLTWHWPERSE